MSKPDKDHSTAWIVQTWISFIISISATSLGIINLPADNWIKSFMGMGLAFSVGSTISLTKTQRDLYENKKLLSKIDEAKVEKILAEHNSLH
jgi:hypothetical protein